MLLKQLAVFMPAQKLSIIVMVVEGKCYSLVKKIHVFLSLIKDLGCSKAIITI